MKIIGYWIDFSYPNDPWRNGNYSKFFSSQAGMNQFLLKLKAPRVIVTPQFGSSL